MEARPSGGTRGARYSVFTASTAAAPRNLPPSVRSALVRTGVWSTRRALADARQVTDPVKKLDALAHVAVTAPTADRMSMLEEALDVAAEFVILERRPHR